MSTENIQPTGQAKAEALSSAAVARRRMLLKGLGKGSAVLAAAVPLQTLASQSVFTNRGTNGAVIRCGISGMTSGVPSRDTTTTVCSGYSPGWWGQQDRDHPDRPRRTWPTDCNPNEAYDVKFGQSTLALIDDKKPTLFQVMSNPNYANTDTRHWICAWLNGMGGAPASWNFPYTGAEVIAFYNGTGPYTATAALDFFKTYMENHSS